MEVELRDPLQHVIAEKRQQLVADLQKELELFFKQIPAGVDRAAHIESRQMQWEMGAYRRYADEMISEGLALIARRFGDDPPVESLTWLSDALNGDFDRLSETLASNYKTFNAKPHFDLVAEKARKDVLARVGLLERRAMTVSNPPRGTAQREEPPVTVTNTVMHVSGGIHNSQVHQGSGVSHQQLTNAPIDVATLQSLLDDIRSGADELDLSNEQRSDLHADIDAATAQLKRSTPLVAVLRESLSSVRTILEGAAGGLLAERIGHFIATLPSQ